jgi:hypothetical protein
MLCLFVHVCAVKDAGVSFRGVAYCWLCLEQPLALIKPE